MGHLPKLVIDLALILITGAITTLIFRRIKQPLVLGYIIAGFLVGPHFKALPSITDIDNVETLAQIGVIFLLFSLGLEFSFKKLMRVGGEASITAIVEIIFIFLAGALCGKALGWSTMDSLFLGGMLASSSTTIIIKAFEELGIKTKHYARIVFGVLVVEDIVVIVLMVLLSTIAVTQQIEGGQILFTILKLIFFLIVWFLAGIFLIPTFLKRAKPLLDEETLLVLAIGLCLGMVVLATQVGFSAELGAFIMGSIIAETTAAERVEHVIKPVKDLFGAVFFISVGMMINPQEIFDYRWAVLIVTLITLFGKLFSTTLGALLSGQPLKQSIEVGMSMAQIGEFAFIVAALGLSLGVISDFLFPVAVGASAITTFTTPYMIKYADKMYEVVIKVVPEKWVKRLNTYSNRSQAIQAESNWRIVIRSYLRIMSINGTILLGIALLSFRVLRPYLQLSIEDALTGNIIGLLIVLVLSSPFLWAFMSRKPDNSAYKELWLHRDYNHGPLVTIEVLRIILGFIIIGFWLDVFFNTRIAIFVGIPIIFVLLFLFSKRIQKFYKRLEGRFISNLRAREQRERETSIAESVMSKDGVYADLSPYDAHVIDLKVPANPIYAKSTLFDLEWREKYGVNVVYIQRGEKLIPAPTRNEVILPHDKVGLLASDEQLQLFLPYFNTSEEAEPSGTTTHDIALEKIVVNEQNCLKGHTIRSSGIREHTSGLVVGIQRANQRILNPESTIVFQRDDIVWIVGDWRKIRSFKAERKIDK